MTARLRIVAAVYRREDGFSIIGRDTHGRQIRVFTTTRDSAERIRAKLAAGQDIDVEDFRISS